MNQVAKLLSLLALTVLLDAKPFLLSPFAQPAMAAEALVETGDDVAKAQTIESKANWVIDSKTSTIKFHIKNLGLPVTGSFSNVSGTVDYDGKRLADASVRAKVDLASINTGISMRDHHLKSKDFFDISNFPSAEFVSTSTEPLSHGKFKVSGDFSLHGIKQPLVITVDEMKESVDKSGHHHIHVEGTSSLARKQFKIGGMAAASIGNDVAITVSLDLDSM